MMYTKKNPILQFTLFKNQLIIIITIMLNEFTNII